MSKYGLLDPGTCLPVIEAVCHVFEVNTALEFGAGIWSTFSLTRNCKSVTSIENIEDWVDVVKENYSHKDNLEVVHWNNPMNDYLKKNNTNFDLIFIDGEDRVECLNDSINRSPIIVCHDTHAVKMEWNRAIIPHYYKQLTYTGCSPYLTTIFYHQDVNLKDTLFDVKNFKHKGTFIDTHYWNDVDIIDQHRLGNIQ